MTRIARKTLVLLAVVFPLLLLPQTNGQVETEVELGYNHYRLFSARDGTPVYMPGESLWLKSPSEVTVRLLGPSGAQVISRKLESGTPVSLYKFTPSDTLGEWRLAIFGLGAPRSYPVMYLGPAGIKVSMDKPDFNIELDRLVVQGNIKLDVAGELDTGLVLLSSEAPSQRRVNLPTDLSVEGSPIFLSITQIGAAAFLLDVAAYAPGLESAVQFTVWAEVITELPLVKKLKDSRVVTFLGETVVRTRPVSLSISNSTSEPSLKVLLPSVSETAKDSAAPLRYGRLVLRFYFMHDNEISLVEIPAMMLPTGLKFTLVDQSEVIPGTKDLSYRFRDELSISGRYSLNVLVRVSGVYLYWSSPVRVPITAVNVFNRLRDEPVIDYSLEVDHRGVIAQNVRGTTYVILPQDSIAVDYSLRVNSISLSEKERLPGRIRLGAGFEQQILVNLSLVTIRVIDSFGNTVPEGRVKIADISSQASRTVLEKDWSPGNPLLPILMPRGRYSIEALVGDLQDSVVLEVDERDEAAIIRFEEIRPEEGNAFSGVTLEVALSILALQTVLASVIWFRNLRRTAKSIGANS